jgi:hypothetical protein
MTIQEVISHVEIRLDYLKNFKTANIQIGNSEMVNKLDIEILETEQTLETLKSS